MYSFYVELYKLFVVQYNLKYNNQISEQYPNIEDLTLYKKDSKDDIYTFKLELIYKPLFKCLIMKGVYGGTKHTFINDAIKFYSQFTYFDSYSKYKHIVNELCTFSETLPMYYINRIASIVVNFIKHHTNTKFIEWNVHSGVKVRQHYNEINRRQIYYNWGTEKSKIKHKVIYATPDNKTTDFKKMKQALAANLIHSLDASIIHKFVLRSMHEINPAFSFIAVHNAIYFPPYFYNEITNLLNKVIFDIFSLYKDETNAALNKWLSEIYTQLERNSADIQDRINISILRDKVNAELFKMIEETKYKALDVNLFNLNAKPFNIN